MQYSTDEDAHKKYRRNSLSNLCIYFLLSILDSLYVHATSSIETKKNCSNNDKNNNKLAQHNVDISNWNWYSATWMCNTQKKIEWNAILTQPTSFLLFPFLILQHFLPHSLLLIQFIYFIFCSQTYSILSCFHNNNSSSNEVKLLKFYCHFGECNSPTLQFNKIVWKLLKNPCCVKKNLISKNGAETAAVIK